MMTVVSVGMKSSDTTLVSVSESASELLLWLERGMGVPRGRIVSLRVLPGRRGKVRQYVMSDEGRGVAYVRNIWRIGGCLHQNKNKKKNNNNNKNKRNQERRKIIG